MVLSAIFVIGRVISLVLVLQHSIENCSSTRCDYCGRKVRPRCKNLLNSQGRKKRRKTIGCKTAIDRKQRETSQVFKLMANHRNAMNKRHP